MPLRQPARRADSRRLAAILYTYAFLDEFVLLYPLYTLLFVRTGLSAGQISSLFVLWALTSMTLEVPSGAWADAVSRRLLLVLGPLLGAVGFGLWVVTPSYPAFAAGFVLWGAKGALVSGALEALVYDELDLRGAARDYPRVWGRAQACGVIAVLCATVLASPVVGAGGYAAVGTVSVLAGLAGAIVALAFPEHRYEPRRGSDATAGDETDDAQLGYLATLRAGLLEARSAPAVRRAVLLVPAVVALWGALEEYTALLASSAGASETQVPWWEAVVWAGVTVGSLAAGRTAGLGDRGLGLLVATASLILAAGAGSGRVTGMVLVAAAFALLQVAGVITQTRVQEAVSGSARATITSLASLGDEVVAIGVYAVYGVLAGVGGDRTAFVVLGLLYLGVAAWIAAPSARAAARTIGAGDTMAR
jgi:MFS family permease